LVIIEDIYLKLYHKGDGGGKRQKQGTQEKIIIRDEPFAGTRPSMYDRLPASPILKNTLPKSGVVAFGEGKEE